VRNPTPASVNFKSRRIGSNTVDTTYRSAMLIAYTRHITLTTYQRSAADAALEPGESTRTELKSVQPTGAVHSHASVGIGDGGALPRLLDEHHQAVVRRQIMIGVQTQTVLMGKRSDRLQVT
jgi:hypothetical protein